MVSVPTGQGPIDAVLETPDGTGPWPGVVVVHDALGIGRDIRDITARVAAHGYLTLTPDLYTRGGRTRCVVGTFRDLIRRRGRAVDDLLSARDLLVARPDCTGRVGVIDARRISEEHLGGYFPNTPMLSAIVQVSRVLEPGRFIADMEASFRHKFATKPQVIQGNMNCLIQSMKEVRLA